MKFAEERFKTPAIINAQKNEEIIQRAPDKVSDGRKKQQMTLKREKFGTSLTSPREEGTRVDGVSTVMQTCSTMDPAKFLARWSEGIDDATR